MEVIVGVLVALIVCSIVLHIIRLGYAMYRLNAASNAIAVELNKARQMAMSGNRVMSVIFEQEKNAFGIDRNGNGKLERAEAEEIPGEVSLTEGTTISFMPSGSPPSKAKKPRITISNTRGSRSISVSSMGSVEIE